MIYASNTFRSDSLCGNAFIMLYYGIFTMSYMCAILFAKRNNRQYDYYVSLSHFFLLNLNAFVYFMYPVCLVKHLRVCSFQFNANVYHCVRVCNVMLIFDRPISHSLTNKRVRVRCPSVIN